MPEAVIATRVDLNRFLADYGTGVFFAAVFADQLGVPLPAVPVLIAAGAFAGLGKMSLPVLIVVAVLASLAADLIWYELGRRRGTRVLALLCRVSLEPDSCVRRTETMFLRHGVRSLLVAKFVPGLNTVAPPLAGIFGVGLRRFVVWDGLGAMIWAGTFMALGYAFGAEIERLTAEVGRWAGAIVAALVLVSAVYVAVKYAQRVRLARTLRMARITPAELRLQQQGAGMVVIDLRAALDVHAAPLAIPGARWIAAEEIDRRHLEIPRDRDVVLYCT